MVRSVLLAVSLAGCGSDDPATKDQDPPTTAAVDDECVRATIGADGGTLEHPDGASLVVDAQDDGEVELCLRDDDIWEILPAAVTGALTLPAAEGDGLFLPSASGGHLRSPLEVVAPGGLSAPLWRGGTAWVAANPTVFRPYGDTTRVDVLVVMDSSGSMMEVEREVATELPVLGDLLVGDGLDFHAGLVTTDLDSADEQGRLHPIPGGARWVEPNTPNAVDVFTDLVRVGSAGSNTERGLGAILLALDEPPPPENVGFRRDSARLVTLIVSNDEDFTEASVTTLAEFVLWYLEVGPFTGDAALHGIVTTESHSDLEPLSLRYMAAIQALGGGTVDVRNQYAWGEALSVMLDEARSVGWTTLDDSPPDAGTVQVWQVPDGVEPTLLDPSAWVWFEQTLDVRVDEALVQAGTPLVVSWTPDAG